MPFELIKPSGCLDGSSGVVCSLCHIIYPYFFTPCRYLQYTFCRLNTWLNNSAMIVLMWLMRYIQLLTNSKTITMHLTKTLLTYNLFWKDSLYIEKEKKMFSFFKKISPFCLMLGYVFGAKDNKKLRVFIDDLNLPLPDSDNTQRCNELLRQLVDDKQLCTLQKPFEWHTVEGLSIISAMPLSDYPAVNNRSIADRLLVSSPWCG